MKKSAILLLLLLARSSSGAPMFVMAQQDATALPGQGYVGHPELFVPVVLGQSWWAHCYLFYRTQNFTTESGSGFRAVFRAPDANPVLTVIHSQSPRHHTGPHSRLRYFTGYGDNQTPQSGAAAPFEMDGRWQSVGDGQIGVNFASGTASTGSVTILAGSWCEFQQLQ
jgi:hypothetical protein